MGEKAKAKREWSSDAENGAGSGVEVKGSGDETEWVEIYREGAKCRDESLKKETG